LAGGVLLLAGCEGDTIVLDADPVAPEATTLSVTSDNPLYSVQEGRGTLRFKTPGGEVVFSVETNAETWSYTNDNEAWLAVEQNEYDGTLTLRAQRNEEASEPAAEVVVTAGEGSGARTWTVEVVQNAAGTPEIVATPNRVLIPACGSLLSASTEIACNYEDWEFTQSCDWMLVERRQDKLVFTADENTSSESRQVEVKLTAGYGDRSISETVVVEQDGRAFVRALPEALSFDYRGGTKTIAVSSNFEWNHAADAKWFAVTRENDVLTVTVDPYDGEQGRTENISLTTGVGENTASLEVAITQMGVNDKYLRWKFEIPSDNATATAMIAGEVDAEINWGDGTVETVTTANPTHVYATAGSHDVEVVEQPRRNGAERLAIVERFVESRHPVERMGRIGGNAFQVHATVEGIFHRREPRLSPLEHLYHIALLAGRFQCRHLAAHLHVVTAGRSVDVRRIRRRDGLDRPFLRGCSTTLPGRPTSPRRSISATAYRRFPKNSSTTIPKRLHSARPSIMWVRR